jgi:hypothetical protein
MGGQAMDDPLDQVRQLAEMARREQPPTGHVSRRVIARLRNESPSLGRPLTAFTVCAATLAVAALFLLLNSYDVTATDPLGTFFQVASMPSL